VGAWSAKGMTVVRPAEYPCNQSLRPLNIQALNTDGSDFTNLTPFSFVPRRLPEAEMG
jgi:hypothetical protein